MELYIVIFVIGLIFGSFLNMLIHRIPSGISLFNPRGSTCTYCKHRIKWYENIPVISYLLIKGKCSNCSKPISIVYPFVEITTALVTLLLYMNSSLNSELVITIALFYTLIVLSIIDLKYKAVPDYLLIIAVMLTVIIGDLMDVLILLVASSCLNSL